MLLVWIWLITLIPLFTALGTWLVPRRNIAEYIHLVGATLLLISGTMVLITTVADGPSLFMNDYIYLDSLNAFIIFILVLVFFITSIYTVGYLRFEIEIETISSSQLHQYYLGFHLFILTMILVMIFNNLALVWIAIELTTLVSALLIAFYRKPSTLEAAWKYLIIGSLGIAFALFGILFLFGSAIDVIGEGYDSFNWTVLYEFAGDLDPTWVTIAFAFVLVGYGTKAGLAPMHFWLPDAHSEAPSPISALLSGVLLNTALYGILRVYLIVNETLMGDANKWLLFFGLFSVGLMVPFILVQHDFKRMLAYSSVEHIGIITFGIGVGGPLGVYGAMLHMLNHSMVKSLLFMAAGNVNQRFQTKQINRVTGLLKVMPFTGIAYTVGILAIAGAPPFNLFISEITIMLAGFQQGNLGLTILFISFILIIFAGMILPMTKMVFGEPSIKTDKQETSYWTTVPLIIPLLSILLFAFYVPDFIKTTLQNIVTLFQGG